MSATESQTGVVTTLLGRRVRLYDLSQEVSQRTQMHPLHPRVEVYPFESHANSKQVLGTGFSYRACLLIMSDHASTHLDAHCHFDPDPSRRNDRPAAARSLLRGGDLHRPLAPASAGRHHR